MSEFHYEDGQFHDDDGNVLTTEDLKALFGNGRVIEVLPNPMDRVADAMEKIVERLDRLPSNGSVPQIDPSWAMLLGVTKGTANELKAILDAPNLDTMKRAKHLRILQDQLSKMAEGYQKKIDEAKANVQRG